MKVYPIFLNSLANKKTVIIGGNREAERKSIEFLKCDANLTLISPLLTSRLHTLSKAGTIHWIPRSYSPGDLQGAYIVIVTDDDPQIREQAFQEAEQNGTPINVIDDRTHCTFTFGSMVKRGPLTIAISTSGTAPTVAVRLREHFEEEFGEEYDDYLIFLSSLRKPMRHHYPDFEQRKQRFYQLADSNLLDAFRAKDYDLAYSLAEGIVGKAVLKEMKKK